MNVDFQIYTVHVLFWSSFGITRAILNSLDRGQDQTKDAAPVAEQEAAAPHSRGLLMFHGLAFGVMYFGLGNAVIPGLVPAWFAGQRIVGAIVIAGGAAIMSWSLVYFRSWRFRAAVEKGHELATGGPFRFLRHPIYMGLNMLALGSAVWVPTAIVWAGFVLMVIGSDLRARAEEKLLEGTFGAAYRDYCARTRRFIPGIY